MRPRSSRNRRALLAGGIAAALLIAAPGTAGAKPAVAAPAVKAAPVGLVLGVPAAAGGEGAATAAGRPVTVTLLTGDQVTVTDTGKPAVRPGPGRTGMQFLVDRDRGHLSVVPRDALPLIRSGRVDRRLFDVTELVSNGYDDARRDSLPLVVSYPKGLAKRSTAPFAGTRVTRSLPTIGGAALTAAKSHAGAAWAALTAGRAGAGVDATEGANRIWLDGLLKPTLDYSVPQIGAPAAYAAGYTGKGVTVAVLDTGIDLTHPDLAGKVADSRNFTTEDPDDRVGHGTHVASIIAGSGAASGGKYRGVAPDATLVSGKVCQVGGCPTSAILAGMQWAAVEKRATVVNMSLGGSDSPGIDPLEEAVNTLTAQTGTLFVISAGNSGPDEFTVGTPGSADAALTVGAVDRNDNLASFSSRGPRVGDGGLKPDITAPGVGIVAARAANGTIGTPVGEKYVALNGTSMASPHVAGAAALLAQQHPGWTAGQYKATLMASAKPHPDQTAFQQGAGRVDVAHAITEQITSDPASVSFGVAEWPHADDEPIVRTVTYRNAGAAPLTLDLAAEGATGPDGRSAPAGMFTLSASQLTVPAGGTAQVTVAADTRLGEMDGYWTGRILARSGDMVAVTPLAVGREGESYNLTLDHRDRAGDAPELYHTLLVGLDVYRWITVNDADGEAQVRVPKGRYGLTSVIYEANAQGELTGVSMLAQPEVVADRDLRISLDARTAKPVRPTVPQRDATVAHADLAANWFTAWGSYGYLLLSDHLDGMTSAQLGEPVPGSAFVGSVSTQWADLAAASSPYLYATSEALPGRFPTGYVKHYQQRDLTTVLHRFRGDYPGQEAIRIVAPAGDLTIGAAALPTTVPGERVEHYSTGTRWNELVAVGKWDGDVLQANVILRSEQASDQTARTVHEDWNAAPYGPSFSRLSPLQGITRNGDTMQVRVPLFSDAAGHFGDWRYDTARTALYRDGEPVGKTPYPGSGRFKVPPGEATYRVETSATLSFTDLSTEVSAAWTFRSTHVPGDDWAQLPAMAVRFAPPLAVDNSAPAGRPFVVPVTVERQPGAPDATVTALTVDVSYDGGKTWRKADLHQWGTGWAAKVQHPAGPGHVSLRATASDSAGNTVTQQIIQAYRLR
ncbi:S8 family serine peptidase [Micromonospora sp. NPDC050200]|uniref:S8 family serine peptidase n=1 Tax=Micromonospora sp. NPDC050200 TaxID=3155664 RepID=UPI0033FE2A8D